MVDLITLEHLVAPLLSTFPVSIEESLVSLSEFPDDKLLELDHIHHVEHGLDLVQHHYAKLIGDRAIAVLLQHKEHCLQYLTPHQFRCEPVESDAWVGSDGDHRLPIFRIKSSLGSYQRAKCWEKSLENAVEDLDGA